MQQPLTWDQRFEQTDFSSKDSIVQLFPPYAQEQYRIKKDRVKGTTNAVNIEEFDLKTPLNDRTLLEDTKLVLPANRRCALFGANATGKTLLLVAIRDGKIAGLPKHLHTHHCRELENNELNDTVFRTVVDCYPLRNILVKCEKKIRELLAADPAPADATKDALKVALEWVTVMHQSIGGHTIEDRAAKMLRVLGFDEAGQQRLCSALSGGLRMRVALAMAFIIQADLLLLDEPTNHLDFPSVLWLENRLRGYSGAFLMVSHDRELLNNVAQQVLLIEDKQLQYYIMDFKTFEVKKAEEDKKKFEDIEKFLNKNRNPDPTSMLGRQVRDKGVWRDNYYKKQIALQGKFTFPASIPLDTLGQVDAEGKPVTQDKVDLIKMENLTFSYNVETGHYIFADPLSFTVTASSRLGVMGPNGAGKSTWLKLLTHKLIPTSGSVTPHPNFRLAYFGQHSTAELELEKTALEFMESQFPEDKAGTLRAHLAKTGVVGSIADTRIVNLSYSQRSCIVFAKLTFQCPHLLILDEPTNFLDLESVDSLITACNKYRGALLLVSHNRDFLRKCARGYVSIVPGHFGLYEDLKSAERATYTFINEMEEGGKVGKKVDLSTGGGSLHAAQKVGGTAEEKDASAAAAAPKAVVAVKAAVAAPKAAAAAPIETYEANEKVQALWTDGKYYASVIKEVSKKGTETVYTVVYTEYGNKAVVPASKLKKLPAPAAKPAGGQKK
jgi:ATPase subunit of ABC transporter with duplicated ATPase domains